MKEIAMRFRWLELINKIGFRADIFRVEAGGWAWHMTIRRDDSEYPWKCELEGKKLTEVLAQAKAETLKYIKGDFLKNYFGEDTYNKEMKRETIWK